MAHDDLAAAFTEGRITRRAFVRQLVDDGVPMPDALARADALVPPASSDSSPSRAEEQPGSRAATPATPVRAPGLVIEFVGDGYLVYHGARDRVHNLNHTAALILELCDGTAGADEIAGLIQRAYGLSDAPVVETRACLDSLFAEDLVR
ncbi:MAG: hypothetical protein AMXMBFR46_25380 [Acidimicrobiia bacterium]